MPQDIKKPKYNLKYILTTRKFLLISIGLSALSLFLFFTLIFPKIQSIQEQRNVLEKEQKKLAKLESKLGILENVNSIDAFSERERIETILPSEKPLFSLLHKFEAAAAKNGVVITSFNVSPGQISTDSADTKKKSTAAKSKTLEVMNLDTTVVGSITDINTFLADVDQLSPLTDVEKISFSAARGVETVQVTDPTQKVFEAVLSLATYFYTGQPEVQVDKELPTIADLDQETLTKLAEFDISEVIPNSETTEFSQDFTPENRSQLFE